jgi:hypothetical protein
VRTGLDFAGDPFPEEAFPVFAPDLPVEAGFFFVELDLAGMLLRIIAHPWLPTNPSNPLPKIR